MPCESVDKLQNALGEKVFHYTRDRKKAAGRALGTIAELKAELAELRSKKWSEIL